MYIYTFLKGNTLIFKGVLTTEFANSCAHFFINGFAYFISGLKTLVIMAHRETVRGRLTEEEMELFKQVLIAMDAIEDNVIIDNIYVCEILIRMWLCKWKCHLILFTYWYWFIFAVWEKPGDEHIGFPNWKENVDPQIRNFSTRSIQIRINDLTKRRLSRFLDINFVTQIF